MGTFREKPFSLANSFDQRSPPDWHRRVRGTDLLLVEELR
jgi:hypothetical protein